MPPSWATHIQLLNDTNGKGHKGRVPSTQWETTQQGHPSPNSLPILLCPIPSTSSDPKSIPFKINNTPALQSPSQNLLPREVNLQQYGNLKKPHIVLSNFLFKKKVKIWKSYLSI